MASYETVTTTDATPQVLVEFDLNPAGECVMKEMHGTAYTSKAECAAGEAFFVWSNDAMGAPVLQHSSNTMLHNSYVGTPSMSADVSGNHARILVAGIAGKTIQWNVEIS